MNRVERGASQQQRLLTFNDFCQCSRKRLKWMLACCNVDRTFHSYFHCFFSLCTLATGCCVEEYVFIGLCSRNAGQ